MKTRSLSVWWRGCAISGLLLVAHPAPASTAAPASDEERIQTPSKRPSGKTETFQVRHGDIVMQTNWGEWGPGMRTPGSVKLLDDPALHGSAMFVYKIRDAHGKIVGFGAQQEAYNFDAQGKLTGRWSTAWTITIPGRGSLFLHQIEDGSGLMAHIELPSDGSSWTGMATAQTTVGPLPDGRGRIVGGTGEFEGRTGSFVEVDHAMAMDKGMKLMPAIDEELILTYDECGRPADQGG